MEDLFKPLFDFSADKNAKLIHERGLCFEEVILALSEGCLLDTLVHHDQAKYPGQQIYIININSYVYMVPFVQKNRTTVFLKTIIPSRKLTKKYLGENDE